MHAHWIRPPGRLSQLVVVVALLVPSGARLVPQDSRANPDQPAAISGGVTTDTGLPARGAIVRAHLLSVLGGPPLLKATAYADERGGYRFENLEPGTYVISAETAASEQEREKITAPRVGPVPSYYPGVESLEAAKPIAIRAGEQLTASFALTQGPLGCVRGSALDARSRRRGPSDGMSLLVQRRRPFGGAYPVSLQPDGTFVGCDIPPGDYFLLATCLGEAAYRPISLNGGDVAASIQTNVGASISGRVVVRRGTDTLTPVAAGARNPSVWLRADRVRDATEDVFRLWGLSTPVRDDGTFHLTGVRGETLLSADLGEIRAGPSSARVIPHRLSSVMRGTEDVTNVAMRLLGAETITDITIVLTLDVGQVQGTVDTDISPRPRNPNVFLFPADPARWQDLAFVHITPLSRDGSWVFDWVAAGPHYAVALDLGNEFYRVPDAATIERLRAQATPVDVKAGATARVNLKLARLQ